MRRPGTAKTVAKRQRAAAGCALPGQTRSRRNVAVWAPKLAPARLSPARAPLFKASAAKPGVVPNLLEAFAFDTAKPEAFVAYRNDLMRFSAACRGSSAR